jgi:hypothetical protein
MLPGQLHERHSIDHALPQYLVKLAGILGLALPNDYRPPSKSFQIRRRSTIAPYVSFKFFFPIGYSGFWHRRSLASSVAVPKTSMHEQRDSELGKN